LFGVDFSEQEKRVCVNNVLGRTQYGTAQKKHN